MSEDQTYYATYCRLESTNADSHVTVDGNTLVIGAELAFTPQVHLTEKGKEVARIVLGRGNQAMGFLPDDVYKRVEKLRDAGWICRAFTSVAVFDKLENAYWSEVAIFCYEQEGQEIFDTFVNGMVKRIAQGEHPAVSLSPKELEQVIESQGSWLGTKQLKLPKLAAGSAYYKTKRTMTENLAYAAAEGNKGCYAGLFVVVFTIIFSIVWFLFLR
jgi:hypothetical protein